jgi:cellulose synthase/poly-beta-1,6-N-acetylglucosamine synthase-like glycosyltransferase
VIKKLLARFEKNTGAVMPKYLTNNRKSLLQKMINIEELILQTSNKISQSIEGSSNVMRGCCFLVKKDIFKKLGGYMQTLTEDVEFAASLKKNNYKITFESNAVIFTHEHDKIGGWFKHKKRCGKGAFYTFLHHKSLSSSRSSLTLSIVIPFMLRICMIGIILATLFSNPYTALIEFLLFLVIEFFHYSLLISFEMKNIDFELLPLFAWIYIPLVLVAYLTGALSAAKDKLLGRDELALKDW